MGEWISVKDRLPDESGEVLVYTKGGVYMTCHYSKKHKAFNAYDSTSEKTVYEYSLKATHWMPLTEPGVEEDMPKLIEALKGGDSDAK